MNSKQRTLVLEIVRSLVASAPAPKQQQDPKKGPTRAMRPVQMLKRLSA